MSPSKRRGAIHLLAILSIVFGGACSIFSSKKEPSVDDRAIETRVSAALAQDPQLKDSRIIVESARGVVELTGFVATSEIKSRAGLLAASTPGVTQVYNDVVVQTAPAH